MATGDTIVVDASSGEEIHELPQRRIRKQTEKARQNEGNYDTLDTALLGTKRQPGGGARAGAAIRASASQNSAGGASESVTLATLQKLVSDQTKVMNVLLESNKELHKKITKIEGELCAANEKLQAVEVQLGDMAAIANSQSSPNPSYADVARTPPGSVPSNVGTLSSWNKQAAVGSPVCKALAGLCLDPPEGRSWESVRGVSRGIRAVSHPCQSNYRHLVLVGSDLFSRPKKSCGALQDLMLSGRC
ncbi:hypothetical protein GQ53DRAFT_94022 [Thozetella sp. PMI_491]|nr:hypothetical protein GQ53DRAFT_94022 [Thozetella sp. PMI_491]